MKQHGLQKEPMKKMTMMMVMVMKMTVGSMSKPAAHARQSSETILKISVFHPHNNSRKLRHREVKELA